MDFNVNLGLETCTKSYEKSMDFEVKNEKNREKSSSKNVVFFDCIFRLILGGFGEDFGRVLGGVWRLLAPLGPLFGVIFWGLYPEGSKSPFGERSEYKLQKMVPKSDPRNTKSLQNPPKPFPKSYTNPPKIHSNMVSK